MNNTDLRHHVVLLLLVGLAHGDLLPPKTLGLGVRAGSATWFVVPPDAGHRKMLIQTSYGLVTIDSDAAGMHATHVPPGVQVIQSFYFAWSALHPQTKVLPSP